jgi:uncharacterized tellurite resistance protein B-like protein
MLSNQSGEIGHFFFAQAFRSGFTGWWATHPPLDDRIRAIDPQFDGKFFEPPEVVDVERESFVSAGLAPGQSRPTPLKLPTTAASAAVGSIGVLSPEQIANAQLLLQATPVRLRDAARAANEASALVFTLLLSNEPATREKQRSIIAQRVGNDAARLVDEFAPLVAQLDAAHKLPLIQLAAPAFRELPAESLTGVLDTLDELVHADAQVSTFEFALQKILIRTLEGSRKPGPAVIDYQSFQAVTHEISVVLSALAYAATSDPAYSQPAFQAGAAQLKLIESRLRFLTPEESSLEVLDAALDKLARASGPIKQRTLMASAHVVTADGQLLVAEAELLRAIAAALDVPIPPLHIA